ncbi:MAG: TolC family protein [Bacteroidetes bacterium]|nr:TolC family protein [Bacteroidota bacterium]
MKILLSVIAIFLLGNSLAAQEIPVPSMLKQLVGQSFQKYPKVGEMNDLVRMSEVKVNLGKAGYWPVAGADVSYRRMYPTPAIQIPVGQGQVESFNIQPANNYNASVSIAQPILDLRTPATVNKAKSELETSKDNLNGFKIQLAYQVAQIYYSIIFLNKSLFVQNEQINLLQSTLQQIDVKVKNGDALNYDLVSTQVKYTNAENFFTDLVTQLNKQYNLLGMLTGSNGTGYLSDTVVNQSTFRIATDSIFSLAFQNNPDIRIAGDKINSAGWDIVSANRLRMPLLNLQAGLGYKNGFMPEIDAVTFNYAVGVGLTIPILSASRPGLQKKLATINLNASKLALESQKVSLNKDLLNSLEDIQKNRKKLSSADTLISQAQLAMDLAADRYKYGVITNLDLLTSITNYKDAQLSRLQYEYNLLLSRMELCRLAGIRWW